ncbi:hypothetical protein EVAR_58778_1 [Eumeta japonica]|uniref:Uncharacterized protein n=1 Tax=Eumeta variegata TaxID=151549 RepID=A0A4C1YMA0_EUMVA|nr:hypothetical protein EVAR_58778_1 [Eumeta japonica]
MRAPSIIDYRISVASSERRPALQFVVESRGSVIRRFRSRDRRLTTANGVTPCDKTMIGNPQHPLERDTRPCVILTVNFPITYILNVTKKQIQMAKTHISAVAQR